MQTGENKSRNAPRNRWNMGVCVFMGISAKSNCPRLFLDDKFIGESSTPILGLECFVCLAHHSQSAQEIASSGQGPMASWICSSVQALSTMKYAGMRSATHRNSEPPHTAAWATSNSGSTRLYGVETRRFPIPKLAASQCLTGSAFSPPNVAPISK